MNPFKIVDDFEAALCEYAGAPYAVTTTSCTMALTLAVAWHLEKASKELDKEGFLLRPRPDIEIPKRTYVGVPYAIREAGGRPTFRDENWIGAYQLKPLPIWDSARWFTGGMYGEGGRTAMGAWWKEQHAMACVSFHWSKTLGIQQGGAILLDDHEAYLWLRRARFDGRTPGVPPAQDTFALRRAWHAYMAPATAAEGLTRLAILPRHNDPIPPDNYPDLSQLEAFR